MEVLIIRLCVSMKLAPTGAHAFQRILGKCQRVNSHPLQDASPLSCYTKAVPFLDGCLPFLELLTEQFFSSTCVD